MGSRERARGWWLMPGLQGETPKGDDAIRFKITPLSDFYSEDDPRYASEAFELQRALRRELPDEVEIGSAPGNKGTLTDLLMTITTTGGITALAEVIKAWLATRPVHRQVDLEFEIDQRKGKRTGSLHIDASNVDSQQLAEITDAAFGSKG
jgi:Effector Associated Constant Component 1